MPERTLILIPSHNEQDCVHHVVRRVLDTLRKNGVDATILVVDDGSEDATASEARHAGARVISHPFNLGYGSALHTGYLYARRHGYTRLVQIDGDGQHEPTSIPVLLQALDDGADVALGSRFLNGAPPPTSFLRRLGTRIFSTIVTAWTGVRVTDPSSGFQALSQRALETLAHDGFPEDYPDADVLIGAVRDGLVLREVPVTMHPRTTGTSMHRGARSAYYGYKMVLNLVLLPWRRRTPFRDRDTVASLQ